MSEILNLYQEDKTGFIDIYGVIVPDAWIWREDSADTSAASFKKQMSKFEDVDEIVVNINSPGGSVFEGVTIFNMLKNHKARVTVNIDGLAASIASVIAMAGDVVKMPSNAMLMIHNAMTGRFGNAKELRKAADDLEKVNQTVINSYLTKVPQMDQAELQDLLDAETWMSAEEALNLGMVDEVVRPVEAVAQLDMDYLNQYNNVPDQIKDMVENEEGDRINGLEVNLKLGEIEGYKEFMNEIKEIKRYLVNSGLVDENGEPTDQQTQQNSKTQSKEPEVTNDFRRFLF